MQPYRTKDWKTFRAEVIQLDGGICVQCGRSSDDGVILNVHHKQYIRGRKPWEYPHDLCQTLCKGCHAATHGIIPPKTGWEYAGWEDLGDLVGTCDLCSTAIRYVFLIAHPDWHPMEVGTNCCDKLTLTEEASDFMVEHHRRSDKLKRFVSSRRWHSISGNTHQIKHKDVFVRVSQSSDGLFQLSFNNISGKKTFSDLVQAKVAVFELFETGKIQAFLSRRSRRRS